MDLGYVLIVVIAFAVIMYVINNFFVLDAKLKGLINIILLLVFLVWLLTWSGIFWGHHAVIR
jgi:hypothetical protein